MKPCKQCNIEKDESEFNTRRNRNGSITTMHKCKECLHKNERKRNNKALKKFRNKEGYKLKNKEDSKKYYENNKKEIQKRRNERRRIKRNNDVSFRLNENTSRSIRHALKKNNSSKNGESCFKYLGYSGEELKLYLEKQFEPWMNWDNHGIYRGKLWDDNDSTTWTWQIDHIIAQAELPYTSMSDENFKICWSLKNLQPLSAKENFLKGQETLKKIAAAKGVAKNGL